MFLEISQNSQENICARVSISIKFATLTKKRLWHRCFPVNITKFLRTPFLTEHLWWLLLKINKKGTKRTSRPVDLISLSLRLKRVRTMFNTCDPVFLFITFRQVLACWKDSKVIFWLVQSKVWVYYSKCWFRQFCWSYCRILACFFLLNSLSLIILSGKTSVKIQ